MTHDAARQILTASLARYAKPFRTVTTLRLMLTDGRHDSPEEEPVMPSKLLSMFRSTCPNLQHLILQGRFNRIILQEYGTITELKKLEIGLSNADLLGNLSIDMPGITTLELETDNYDDKQENLIRALQVLDAGSKLVQLNLGERRMEGDTWTLIPSRIMTLQTEVDWSIRDATIRYWIWKKLMEEPLIGPKKIPKLLSLPALRELHWSGTVTEFTDLLRAAPNLSVLKGTVNSTCQPEMLGAWVNVAERMYVGLRCLAVVLHIERINVTTSNLLPFLAKMPCLPYITEVSICNIRKMPIPNSGEKNMFDTLGTVFPNVRVLQGFSLIFDDEALHALMGCMNLRELHLQTCQYMTTMGIMLLASHHVTLKVIILVNCGGVQDSPSHRKILAQFGKGARIDIFEEDG